MARNIAHYDHVAVIAIPGDFSGENVAQFVEDATHCRETDKHHILVDCAEVGHIDSAGLEALLELQDRCEEHLGAVKLCGMDATCKKILEITRLARRFEVFDDLESGVKSFS